MPGLFSLAVYYWESAWLCLIHWRSCCVCHLGSKWIVQPRRWQLSHLCRALPAPKCQRWDLRSRLFLSQHFHPLPRRLLRRVKSNMEEIRVLHVKTAHGTVSTAGPQETPRWGWFLFLHWNLDAIAICPPTDFRPSQSPCALMSSHVRDCMTSGKRQSYPTKLTNPTHSVLSGDIFSDFSQKEPSTWGSKLKKQNQPTLQRTAHSSLWLKPSPWKMDIISSFHGSWLISTEFSRQHFTLIYRALWHLKNQEGWTKVLNVLWLCFIEP